jgi:RNA polymerase sigma-70 factor, ECF subfamily
VTTLASEHLSDQGLLALVARGDHEAFARLYDGYGAAAHALAARIVRDRGLAADVVQDAFLTLWSQASRFDAARGEPSTWILSLTHHKAVDVVRRESRRHQEVLQLAYFAGYTQSELAERLAVPIGTIKSRTFAAITALREQMVALGMRPEQE